MKTLITGVAGFIGYSVCRCLLDNGYDVIGIDNINDYYDQDLKYGRLAVLGVDKNVIKWNNPVKSTSNSAFSFIRMNLEDAENVDRLFRNEHFDIVINLAGQAGVRYSLQNPRAYVQSNIHGFLNVLEGCRNYGIKHLIYASSSSVYGLNADIPFSEHASVDHPVSIYAATKKSNELMAHAYSYLYDIPTTGLRFFTVYGPWGRPDMSPFLFMDAIINKRPIKVFNNGDMMRDFTYIDDIVEGIRRIVDIIPQPNSDWDSVRHDSATSSAPYRIYNIGNQHPVKLLDYIECIEKALGYKAEKKLLPMQPGDVYQTYADSNDFEKVTGFCPRTSLETGIVKTVEWFKEFYG